MKKTLAEELADLVVETEYEDLPKNAVEHAKIYGFLDHVGVILNGSKIRSSRIMIDYVLGLGGKEQSTIIGTKTRTSCPYAALANGTSGHALELDDDNREATLHPGVVSVPASLAVGEWKRVDGKVFLTALMLGYEVHCRIGAALLGIAQSEGFHPTGTCGVFAAAAAAGKVLGLNRSQMVNAFGIAGSLASGLMEWIQDGTWTKRMHPGRAAEGGIMAAMLAQSGYTGPTSILEGKWGFLNAYSYGGKYDSKKVTNNLGKKWMFLQTGTKLYASCRFTHHIIEPTITLTQRHRIKPEDVEHIEVRSGRFTMNQFAEDASQAGDKRRKYEPQTVVDAQFSGPFCVATAMLKRRALHTEFTDETIKDPEVLGLASKVKGIFDPEAEKLYPRKYRANVTIRLKDGTEYSQQVDYPKGEPENAASEHDIIEKFAILTRDIPLRKERIENIVEWARELDKVKDMSDKTSLLMF